VREDAESAMRYINGTRLDDRIVRTDWDAGFIEGRQYGRGKSGGQVRLYKLFNSHSKRGQYVLPSVCPYVSPVLVIGRLECNRKFKFSTKVSYNKYNPLCHVRSVPSQ